MAFCRSAALLAGRESRCSLLVNATGLNGGPVSHNLSLRSNWSLHRSLSLRSSQGTLLCFVGLFLTDCLWKQECYPVRGQLVLVRAPYVKQAMGEYATADHAYPTYIYPRRDHIVLGSTYLEHDGGREVSSPHLILSSSSPHPHLILT